MKVDDRRHRQDRNGGCFDARLPERERKHDENSDPIPDIPMISRAHGRATLEALVSAVKLHGSAHRSCIEPVLANMGCHG